MLDILVLLFVSPCLCVAFIVCSSIDTPVYWFDPWHAFYHCLLCIHRFLAKSHVHMWIFGQKSRIHAGFWPKPTYTCSFWPKVVYTCSCSLNSRVHPPFWLSLMLWEVVGWVVSVVGSSWVLMLSVGCLFCDQRLLFH